MAADNVLLKVATLNTWHGLNGKGTVYFGTLETRRERMARLNRQISCLKALSADVLLLQEINPLPFRAHWYAQELGKKAMSIASNSGVKLGWGLPGNLNEGLCVLYPFGWDAELLGKKRLSGSFRLSPFTLSEVGGPFLSLQLHESRIALAVRLHIPSARLAEGFSGPSSVLLGVTHLHHAPSLTPRNAEILEHAKDAGLTPREEKYILHKFHEANARRVSEVDTLGAWLEGLRRPGEPIILGGDFNCEPQSPPLNTLIRRNWSDSWELGGNSEDLKRSATWDPPRNPFSYRAQKFIQPGSGYSDHVTKVMNETDALARRIDFLFLNAGREDDAQKNFGCLGKFLNVRRFGFLKGNSLSPENLVVDDFSGLETKKEYDFKPDDDLKFPSDHYGLVANFGMS